MKLDATTSHLYHYGFLDGRAGRLKTNLDLCRTSYTESQKQAYSEGFQAGVTSRERFMDRIEEENVQHESDWT